MKKIIYKLLQKLYKPILVELYQVNMKLDSIMNKMSISADSVINIDNLKLFIPNAPRDILQNEILQNVQFYEIDLLRQLDKYLSTDSVIIDIGANIGNHTVYWGRVTKVKQIYAFEPISNTCEILLQNIKINDLENIVKTYNVALGNSKSKAEIQDFINNNIGATSIIENDSGSLTLDMLDNIEEIFLEKKIDFVKIDVEGFEKYVLQGASKFFVKYKPKVFIESFSGLNQYDFVIDFFNLLGYKQPVPFPGGNYLFIHPE